MTGCVANVEPLDEPAGWVETASVVAVPGVPVAVNVTGDPVRPSLVAVSVFEPAVVPSVQLVTAATPSAPVVTAVVGSTDPPPDATANVTLTPDTGLLFASVTSTLGTTDTALPATADWPSPALIATVAALPGVPVAVNVTGEPVRPSLVAVSVF